jgi:tetratricopeptide (TPR) repeat protein
MLKSYAAKTVSLLFVTIVAGTQVLQCLESLAKAAKPGAQAAPATQAADWQADEEMAVEYEQQGRFDQAEKLFLRAKKNLLIEFKHAPPSSFSTRWFPLQDALRGLYLNRAVTQEDSLPFAKIDECYKKALKIPGTSYEMWQRYADFLKRKGKAKQAEKVEKEGKKKCLYQTN